MGLRKALKLLVAEFDKNGVDYAVIGGFALGARGVEVFGRELAGKVARPEDLIALKLQAVNNNPARRLRDGADIEELMRGLDLDWGLLKKYFELFGEEALCAELKTKYSRR